MSLFKVKHIRHHTPAPVGSLIEPLIQALEDNPGDDFGILMHALGKLHDPRAIEPIVKHLKSGLSYRRGVAADVLGGLGDKRAIVLLTKLLRDCAICRGEKTQPTKIE